MTGCDIEDCGRGKAVKHHVEASVEGLGDTTFTTEIHLCGPCSTAYELGGRSE